MIDYSQPAFYHFNEDSLKLVNFIAKDLKVIEHLLDVGCGCGVIGIELARKISIKQLDMVEVQEDFKSHLLHNLSLFIPQQKNYVFITPLSKFVPFVAYDLIVCNPPYYLPGSGQANKDERKGICRSFQIDSWNELLGLFVRSLSPSGNAWVVIKNDKSLLKLIESEVRKKNLNTMTFFEDDLCFIKFYFDV